MQLLDIMCYYAGLDSEQYDTIVSSMFPVAVTAGQKVIR